MAKILLVIDCLGSGGAQRQLVSLAKRFVSKGHSVTLFSYFPELNHFEPDVISAGIRLHYGSKKHRFSLSPIFSLAGLIRQENYDGILGFLRNPSIYMQLGYILARCCGASHANVIFSERLNYFEREKKSLIFRLVQQNHRICHEIVANNHFQRKEMAEMFPWMKPKLHTIYNGLDEAIFKSKEKTSQQLTLLTVARVVDYKNYHNLALALIFYLQKWGAPPKVNWVGKVFQTPENIELFTKTKQLLKDHQLEATLIFHGEQKEVENYYQSADALIHPSKIEGFSNVVIEASEYGLPLLLGNIGDQPYLIEHFEAGLIFDVENPEDIARKIKLFVDAEESQRLHWKEQAMAARKQLFDLDSSSDSYLSLLLNGENNEN